MPTPILDSILPILRQGAARVLSDLSWTTAALSRSLIAASTPSPARAAETSTETIVTPSAPASTAGAPAAPASAASAPAPKKKAPAIPSSMLFPTPEELQARNLRGKSLSVAASTMLAAGYGRIGTKVPPGTDPYHKPLEQTLREATPQMSGSRATAAAAPVKLTRDKRRWALQQMDNAQLEDVAAGSVTGFIRGEPLLNVAPGQSYASDRAREQLIENILVAEYGPVVPLLRHRRASLSRGRVATTTGEPTESKSIASHMGSFPDGGPFHFS